MSGTLEDRVVVVTGGGRGMGRAFAERLVSEDAIVAIAEIDEETGQETERSLRDAGGRAHFYPTDVRQSDQIQRVVDDLLDRYGHLDGLVNNAGVASGGPSESVTEDEWDRVLSIMLTGVFRCSQIAARTMLDQGRGSIVNIASIAGIGGWYERACYNTAKAGVNALTKVLGIEWAENGVRVNAVAPGQIETPLNEYVFSQGLGDRETFTNRAPQRRFAQPAEVADVVAFLLSDESSYITAETIVIDGGWLAWGQMHGEEGLGV